MHTNKKEIAHKRNFLFRQVKNNITECVSSKRQKMYCSLCTMHCELMFKSDVWKSCLQFKIRFVRTFHIGNQEGKFPTPFRIFFGIKFSLRIDDFLENRLFF